MYNVGIQTSLYRCSAYKSVMHEHLKYIRNVYSVETKYKQTTNTTGNKWFSEGLQTKLFSFCLRLQAVILYLGI